MKILRSEVPSNPNDNEVVEFYGFQIKVNLITYDVLISLFMRDLEADKAPAPVCAPRPQSFSSCRRSFGNRLLLPSLVKTRKAS